MEQSIYRRAEVSRSVKGVWTVSVKVGGENMSEEDVAIQTKSLADRVARDFPHVEA